MGQQKIYQTLSTIIEQIKHPKNHTKSKDKALITFCGKGKTMCWENL